MNVEAAVLGRTLAVAVRRNALSNVIEVVMVVTVVCIVMVVVMTICRDHVQRTVMGFVGLVRMNRSGHDIAVACEGKH